MSLLLTDKATELLMSAQILAQEELAPAVAEAVIEDLRQSCVLQERAQAAMRAARRS